MRKQDKCREKGARSGIGSLSVFRLQQSRVFFYCDSVIPLNAIFPMAHKCSPAGARHTTDSSVSYA